MTHSFATEAEAGAAGVAEGHYPFFGITSGHTLTFVPGSVPSSFLASSASDLGNFLRAHLNQGRFDGGAVLTPQGMATVQAPITSPSGAWDGYAMGWWVFPLWSAGQLEGGSAAGTTYEVPVILEHQGDHESYASSVLLIPEHRLGVAVLLNVNDESAPSRFHQIHLGIASILLGASPQPFISEDAIRRNVKVLALVIVGLFLLRAGLSAMRLRRTASRGGLGVVQHFVIPLVIDIILIGGLWWFLATESGVPLTLVRRSTPDVVLAAALATGIGIAWAIVRSVRVGRALGRSRSVTA